METNRSWKLLWQFFYKDNLGIKAIKKSRKGYQTSLREKEHEKPISFLVEKYKWSEVGA